VDTLITDEMRGIVGVVLGEETSYPIAASDIRKWAFAVYYPEIPPSQFWDEDDPVTIELGGIVAPEDFNPFGWFSKDPRPGSAKVGETERFGDFESVLGVEPPAYQAVLVAESLFRFGDTPMRPGDVLHSATRITDYSERQGRMGLQLYTTLSTEMTNQDGDWVKTLGAIMLRY
jgi:N-terminal half of MaoC dehydratase